MNTCGCDTTHECPQHEQQAAEDAMWDWHRHSSVRYRNQLMRVGTENKTNSKLTRMS